MKWGYISAQNLKSEPSKKLLCLFHCKPWPSGVSLESPELENIPQLPGNQAEAGQNDDAPKAVSATISVKVKYGCISTQKLESESSKKLLCLFHCKPRLSKVSLASPGIENIRQLPGNRAEVGQNYDARKAVSATLSVLK